MAMLAGPRQKKRYNLVPKGKALFEDGDRFGTKMLEKMGWSKGKGLGSKENGQQEFVRIRYKNDANGLGYEDRDDQWTEHEKHFNGLLESLHAGDSNSNTASADDADDCAPRIGFGFESSKTSKEKLKDKFSGQSLEERSKQSKARVHYKKFTKGKDMTQYSEKDLANIFGKKATAEQNDFYSQLPSFKGSIDGSDEEAENKPVFELGTHTVNTGLSVSDYFKMKMEALKSRKGVVEKKEEAGNCAVVSEDNVQEIVEDESTESTRKKKKKNKKQKLEDMAGNQNGLEADSEEKISNEEQTTEVCINDVEESVVKSKKKKSKRDNVCESAADCTNVITVEDEANEEQRPKKKKKKNTADQHVSDQVMGEIEIPNENGPASEKSALCQNGTDCVEIIAIEDDTNEEPLPKKKKKKTSAENYNPEQDISILKEKESAQRNSLRQTNADLTEIITVEDDECQEQRPKKKKKPSTDDTLHQVTEETSRAMDKERDLPLQMDEVATSKNKKKNSKKTPTDDTLETEGHTEKESTELGAEEQSQKKKKSKKRPAEESTDALRKDATDTPLKTKKVKASAKEELPDLSEKKKKTELQTSPEESPILTENSSAKSKKKLKTEANPPTAMRVKKFRHVDLASFNGSNISEQNGYGLSENLELQIVDIDGDQERIMKLWSGRSNKYNQSIPKQEIYKNYMKKVKQARKQKKKIPKLKVKPLHRLVAFQSL